MAQAAEQHTPSSIEWSLDDYVAQLIVTLGCEKYPALWGMWDRIANRRLLFFRLRLVDGKPYSPWDHKTIHGTPKPFNKELVDADYFRSNYRFEFDDHDRVRVNSQEWFVYRYTVAEPLRPPASQTAPDQQPEDKARAGRPSPRTVPASDPPKRVNTKEWIKAEVIQLKKDNAIPSDACRRITNFAKFLEKRMDTAAEINKLIRPAGWGHIKNLLYRLNFWPIESIKIS
jgi:hypothetical protein